MSSVDTAVQAALIAVRRNQPPPTLWPATITNGADPKQILLRLDGHDADSGAQSLLGQLQDGERVMTILSPPQLVLVVSVIATSWIDVTFENSWVDYGSGYATCQYRKCSDGDVEIRGVAKSGTINSPIFTLPVLFRPPLWLVFPSNTATSHARFDVRSDGVVDHFGAVNTDVTVQCRFATI